MTVLEHLAQVQQVVDRQYGTAPLYLLVPETQERLTVALEMRISPEGAVYVALVPVAVAAR